MQFGNIMKHAGGMIEYLKVPVPSAATIAAWFSDFNFIEVTEVVQEIGILAIIILNAWWVWHKIKGKKQQNQWAREDRLEEEAQ